MSSESSWHYQAVVEEETNAKPKQCMIGFLLQKVDQEKGDRE